ncbi:proline-rich receptor-like protein kinase PERK9 [Iris pallida]|uniref:Proline-rich receptor-like protein kinase PERK9 n=1 Tax=Iris pallida TaxID=29817 RepID=A0AAX6FTH5_IRIPA|nr:proline-rich receptor-like protein kinase PERK9 [Iris pallida]
MKEGFGANHLRWVLGHGGGPGAAWKATLLEIESPRRHDYAARLQRVRRPSATGGCGSSRGEEGLGAGTNADRAPPGCAGDREGL